MLATSQERLLRLALRCYPERWRARHGDEAAELATLLAQDGVPLRSMTWSYFKGAARERLLRPTGQRVRAGAAAVVAAALTAICLVVSVPLSPAGAASVVRVGITNRSQAAAELREVFKAHHFDIAVEQLPVSPSLVGSILGTRDLTHLTGREGVLGKLNGTCVGGSAGCSQGLLLPSHFTGHVVVLVGRAARSGEKYAESADIFRPGELLARSGLLGRPVGTALAVLGRSHLAVLWYVSGQNCSAAAPSGRYKVLGGFAVSGTAICLKAAPSASTTRGRG
jgi:hypothetical protein